MAKLMEYEVAYREPGNPKWITVGHRVLGVRADVWRVLYNHGGTGRGIGLPERVRISVGHLGSDEAQVLFEGSYPAAIMWLLGIWDIPAKKKLELEKLLKEALCIQGGDCKEKNDGEEDHLEGSNGG